MLALIVTLPLVVDVGALKVKVSPSASLADTVPVTTPVAASGVVTDAVPAIGFAFAGLIMTVTGMVAMAPLPSLAVTAKESVVLAANAPFWAAACRAVAVGV